MKKFFSVVLVALMLLTAISFTACGEKVEELKFGMGVYAYNEAATSADGDTTGKGETIATVAAVLVDKDGKIVKCEIDTADCTVEYTSAGEAVAVAGFKTKYELGADYNMAAFGNDVNGDGVVKEWFEQVDAFESVAVGKTAEEVKALLGENSYNGTDDVMAAGCTIGVSDFIFALEKAVNNAVVSTATANDTLGVGIVSSVSNTNATEDANGSIEIEITAVAAAKNADNKVVVCDTDVATSAVAFDVKGATVGESGAAITTKKEQGAAYGMVSYGGAEKEWFEQAAAFNAACAGKTADEIAALVVDGYGVESLQTAGCTIAVSDIVNAAVKAAK
ncbi:MAG: hypothetical protein IJA60_04060 [Clostridia bacterium]|nr:hypothetical protein [Clostridia bacterium]